jgi:plastocyanin
MKRLTPLLVVTALLLTATPAQAATQTVSIVDNGFNPTTKTVNRGDTVKWTNTGFQGHTTTGNTPLSLWGSVTLGHNAVFTSPVLTAAGTYPYYCKLHATQMKGKIQVPLSLKSKVGKQITLTLASAPAATGYKYVLQRKNGTTFATVATVTTATAVFNAPSTGSYTFRAALQKGTTVPSSAFFSQPLTVTV